MTDNNLIEIIEIKNICLINTIKKYRSHVV